VTRRRWISEEDFEHGIAATNLLPGPASTQLAIFCAWRLRGIAGAVIGGTAFIVPGLVLIIALAALFLGSPPAWVRGLGAGGAAVVAAVAVRAGIDLIGPSRARAAHPRPWAIYADIAVALDKTPAAVRQIAHRAREHVAARRPRIQVDRAEQQQVVDRFLAALRTGDLQVLVDVLAPDVVLVADGGGEVAAVRRPVVGRDRVATLLSRFKTVAPDAVVGSMWLNGAPAGRIDLAGELDTAVSLVVGDGRISRIYAIRNPHKLARLDEEATLSR